MSDKTQLVNIQKYLMRQPIDMINGDDGEYYLSTVVALELAQQILDICQPQCKWKMDINPDYESMELIVWESTCGNAFVLNEGTPEENDMNYCPYCGGRLIQE